MPTSVPYFFDSHRLGHVFDKKTPPQSVEEAMQQSGLDWDVEKKTLHLAEGEVVSGYKAIIRTDTGGVLGVVGQRYQPLQNKEAFTFMNELIKDGVVQLEVAGATLYGKKVFVLGKLNGECEVGQDDVVDKYVLLTNSHDGTGAVQLMVTPFRKVCTNALASTIRVGKKVGGVISIRHTKSVSARVDQAKFLLHEVSETYEKLHKIWGGMTKVQMLPETTMEYLKGIFPDNEKSENTSRTQALRAEVLQFLTEGMGQQLDTAEGTLWGAYNGVTQYLTHRQSTRKDATFDKHLDSLWHGTRARQNDTAFQLAMDLMRKEGVSID